MMTMISMIRQPPFFSNLRSSWNPSERKSFLKDKKEWNHRQTVPWGKRMCTELFHCVCGPKFDFIFNLTFSRNISLGIIVIIPHCPHSEGLERRQTKSLSRSGMKPYTTTRHPSFCRNHRLYIKFLPLAHLLCFTSIVDVNTWNLEYIICKITPFNIIQNMTSEHEPCGYIVVLRCTIGSALWE